MAYEQIHDGQWVELPKRGLLLRCCDCGLVHKVNFRIKDNEIDAQFYRKTKATYDARKNNEFVCTRKPRRKRKI